MKKILAIFAAAVLTIGLCACGSKRDYSQLEKLLDKGQYDAAITMIEQYKAEASKEPTSLADIEAADQEILNKIVGEYTKLPNYSSNDSSEISVNSDMTVTVDGATYPFELEKYDDGKPYIKYEVKKADGGSSVEIIRFDTDENTGFTAPWGFQKLSDVTPLAMERWEYLKGSYIYTSEWANYKTVVLGDDFTITLDGKTYNLEYCYNSSYNENPNDPYWVAYRKGHTIDFYYQPDDRDGKTSLEYSIDDDGFVTLMGNYHNEKQLDFVDITAENINDYFEMSGYKVIDKKYNAFNELEEVTFANNYRLKSQYADKYVKDASTVAIEYAYNSVSYPYAKIIFNAATDGIVIEKGETSPYITEYTNTASEIFDRGYYDENGIWVHGDYVLFGDYAYISDIGNNEKITKAGDEYTAEEYLSCYYADGNLRITRSATKLAFKKAN